MRNTLLIVICLSATAAKAASKPSTLSIQGPALAPNAGGQDAYAVRLLHGDFEYGAFSNQYLLAGNQPLWGGTVDRRFAVCGHDCWWQFFTQVGGGLSTGGPLAQITWGTILPMAPLWLPRAAPRYLPALRLEFTTQFIFVRYRAITWSYPLWAGISVSF